jgi:8-oxo-dGTP diphosphatase
MGSSSSIRLPRLGRVPRAVCPSACPYALRQTGTIGTGHPRYEVDTEVAAEGPPFVAPRYENPALTADAVWIRGDRILLVRRGRPPFQGMWALPGGFVELEETVEEAVARELREETGLIAKPWKLVGVYSGPDRDPRKPTTSIAFLMRGRAGAPRGGDDAATAEWRPVRAHGPLAFDHARIVRDARRVLRALGRA